VTRATWLTDVHLNFVSPEERRAFHADVIAEEPDAILLTGDLGEADSVVSIVDDLAMIAPCYFVLGNHDYYGASIAEVRARVQRDGAAARWLPAIGPVALGGATMIGVDGWGDARCGDLDSPIELSDWRQIRDFDRTRGDRRARLALLRQLGAAEALALRETLARTPACAELLVLTHVPPFPEACTHDGKMSEPAWLPWFTCIATGEVLAAHARAHPSTKITVLCGHTHGRGTFHAAPNLEVRTGGWPPRARDYGNPIVQATLTL
jgi:predicted phosphohydrolase